MTVKVVTDSACDIPAELVEELGITVVPIYVMFGQKAFRDRIDSVSYTHLTLPTN